MPNRIIPYRQDLKVKARELRNNSTLGKILLWQEIKQKSLGYEFHRQVPLLDFVVDFFCHELLLAIEVDGDSHDHTFDYDKQRQKALETYGIRLLRFDDKEVKFEMRYVLEEITHFIEEHQKSSNACPPV
ncbi:endonuclease domain-containing protein [Rufibacter quisquiliarum]|uniref:Very-short-patch-repair endonuclease n=1 Tax=Rufibacter quisquiliarum TaxID=1549639 RepID=A0A839GXL2_9BACT|nr:endonuclease domain-containing protein [Rufibacter quisquiliarum]MBA9079178.1 very-short-patch-repair endonuclease [Rufibacter quisquiliarum]